MGSRSAAETVIALLQAFIEERTWTQADLARRLGLTTPQVKKRLDELSRLGVPLEAEPDHPHVYWSVPQRWFPSGIVLSSDHAQELLRQLSRTPASDPRNELLKVIASAARAQVPIPHDDRDPGSLEKQLRLVEDALSTGEPLVMQYIGARHGSPRRRTVTVHRIMGGPRVRFVATSHASGELRIYRVSRIVDAQLCSDEPAWTRPEEEVTRFVAETVGGFRDPMEPVPVAFVVREPELRWVADSLPLRMEVEPVVDGLRFTATTAGITTLARFVVGLGAAARAETPELAQAVRELAQGSLIAHGPNIRSVTTNRSTDWDTGTDASS